MQVFFVFKVQNYTKLDVLVKTVLSGKGLGAEKLKDTSKHFG